MRGHKRVEDARKRAWPTHLSSSQKLLGTRWIVPQLGLGRVAHY